MNITKHSQPGLASVTKALVLVSLVVATSALRAQTNTIGTADGSIETDLTGMVVAGDIRQVPNIGVVEATQGSLALLLTNEPDAGSRLTDADVSTLLIENFTIDAQYATLRLDYTFLTNEPGPSYANDMFEVTLELVTSGGDVQLIASDTFDQFTAAPWTGYDVQTGYRTMIANVAPYGGTGEVLTLQLQIADVGDGRRNSAVLIDDIRLVEPGVPQASVQSYFEISPGQTINFDGSGSSDDLGITGFDWDFGNGFIGSGPNVAMDQYTQAGIHHGTLTVTDSDGNTDTADFTVVVGDGNTGPSIVSAPDTVVNLGASYRYQLVADDAEVPFGDVLTYSLVNGPVGMNVDPASGLVSWTPNAATPDDNPVTVQVADSVGLIDQQNFSITLERTSFIIATDDSGRVYYARSNGDGTWSDYRQEAQVAGLVRGTTIADFDNDGDWDFLVPANPSGNRLDVHLFVNDGSDQFSVGSVTVINSGSGGAYGMTSGDFDNDGNVDFLINRNGVNIVQGLGDGQGNFAVSQFSAIFGNGRGIDVADFDHDGNLDFVRTDSSARVKLYSGDGQGGFVDEGQVADSGSDSYALVAGDFTNDGHADFIGNSSNSGAATLYAGNGDGTFQAGLAVPSIDFNNFGKYDDYDFNGDGFLDLITVSHTSRTIRYYPGNGDGTFGAEVRVNPTNTTSNTLGVSAPPGPPPIGDPIPLITPDFVVSVPGATINLSGANSTDDGAIVAYDWDFGDGETGSGVDVSHTFPAVEGDYNVQLRVMDDSGRQAVATAFVRLTGSPPVANAGGAYIFGESFANGGLYTVTLDGSNSSDDGPAPLRFDWDLGDGLNGPIPGVLLNNGVWAHTNAALDGTGSATVTGGGGWGSSYLFTQRTYPRIDGQTYRGRLTVPSGSGNRFVMWGLKTTAASYSFQQLYHAIYFANGNLQIYESGSFRGTVGAYTPDVTYDVRIDVKTQGATYYVREFGAATWTQIYDSVFSSASPFRVGATVHSGAIELSHFETPNSLSSDEQPVIAYAGPDQYDVQLTVTDGVMQQDTDSTTVSLVAGALPIANPGGPYTLTEADASCGQWSVNFDGSGSSDDVGIFRYDWDFGDGNSGTGVTPTHVYATGGSYDVTLTVIDNALQMHTATTTVTTTAQDLPVADPGGPYQVDESSANQGGWTSPANGGGTTDDFGVCDYVWEFGDGGTANGVTPSHVYNAANDYTVTLTVRDNALQSHSATTTYSVITNDPPVADSGGPYAVDENQAQNGLWTASFDASGSTDDFGVWTHEWDFGDGNTGSGATATHVYAAPGTYDVTLTVTDNGRQTSVVQTQITVGGNGVPLAEAGPDQTTELGKPVTLDASASTDDFGIASYQWDPGLPPFSETFDGSVIDPSVWATVGGTGVGQEAVVTGVGSWGARYLFTNSTFTRAQGDSYTGRIVTGVSGNQFVMWGLKNTSANYSFTQMPYAIYFNNGSISIYEDGANRGVFGSFVNGTSYDVRIDLKAPSGATYFVRETGTSAWTQLRDSTHSSATSFRFGATVHSGAIRLDDFAGPDIGLVRPDLAVVEVVYREVGNYQPSVTVTDNAQQADSDALTVNVVLGNPPQVDSGGPYSSRIDFPTRFNARGSSDDFGIQWYEWDFGDGESLRTRNPWADHRYASTGTFAVTLTVTDYAGQGASETTSVTIDAEPLVATIPWAFSGGLEVPHDTWSGNATTLKGVVWAGADPMTYEWDFGDGSPVESGAVTNRRAIQASHAYTGVEGQPFVATLTVTDANGATSSDNYLLRIREKSLDIEINAAIDEGLWAIHKNQLVDEFAVGTYGDARIDQGHWDQATGGGFGGANYVVAPTSSSLQAMFINGHLEQGDVIADPYTETVSQGLNYLFHALRTLPISTQAAGDPDTNGNGVGIETRLSADFRHPYEIGQSMDAIIAGGNRNSYSITGQGGIIHRSHEELVRDQMDAYAYGQTDSGAGRGGWRYSWNNSSDNSVAGWAAIGLIPAERIWNLPLPQFVKDENLIWLNRSYNGTGFGYAGPGNGTNTTPAAMVQLVMDDVIGFDDPATGADERDPMWATAEDFIANNWNANFWYPNGAVNNRYAYYAYFNFTKAMRLANPQPVVNLPATGLDWFKDDVDGIARRLVDRQQTDGQWPKDSNPGNWVGLDLSNAWSVIMLTPTLFVQPPSADAGGDRVWGVDVELTLDGSGSFHQDPFRDIVLYEWDIDGDGTFDTSSTEPTTTVTYTSAQYPEASLPQNVVVTLRVTDNNDPVATDTDTAVITIAVPPHPPVADAGGPYNASVGVPIILDGSASFDIDPTDFITAYEWDLDNDGEFDDAFGPNPTATFLNTGVTNVGLRVVDNAVLNDVNGNGVQDPEERLDDFDFTTVVVTVNDPPAADANGPYTVDEGSSVSLDASASIDPNGNALTYAWDFDDDGVFDDASGPTPDFLGVDDAVVAIAVQVSDTVLVDTATSTVTVNNVAPSVDAGPDQSVNEGATVAFSGSFSDPGVLDTHTIDWDFGDGNTVSGSLAPTHVYPDNGIYLVTLTITDDDGGVGSDVLTVTVGDLGPNAVVTGSTALVEGDTGNFDASLSTSAPDVIVGYEWDFDFDGSFEPSGDTGVTANTVFPENGLFTVAVRVTDDDGSTAIAEIAVTVVNANPVVEAGADQSGVQVGSAVALDPATFTDLGLLDTHTAIIDWGDGTVEPGSVTQGPGTGSVDGAHEYATGGTFIVTVIVTDDDGGIGADTFTVNVIATQNAPPTVDAGPDAALIEGDTFTSGGLFTDPDADSWTATVDYGEGAGTTPLALNPDGTFALSNLYQEDGIYTTTVTVTDSAGGVGIDTALVTVNNAAPAVEAGADQSGVQVSSAVALDPATFTDLGLLDTHTAIIDWGDGTVEPGLVTQAAGSGSVDGGHAYTSAGTYTVSVTVTDDDGGVGSDTLTVTVDPAVQPDPPSDLDARPKRNKIQLTWAHNGANSYNVYRSLSSGAGFALVANTTSTYSTYLDEGVITGTTYYYYITSVVGGVESAPSVEVNATLSARTRR